MAKHILEAASVPDEASIVALMTLAFSADPATRWTWPDPQQYLRHFPDLVKALGGKALSHGGACHVDSYAGAAMWLPPGIDPDEDELADLLQRTGHAAIRKDLSALFEQMARHHPQEPHWFLPFIGIDPFRQGMGYGTALMRHALGPCDRDGAPAYLESSNPKNIPFYERHGFELLGTIQAGTSPPIFPMLRKPRRPQA